MRIGDFSREELSEVMKDFGKTITDGIDQEEARTLDENPYFAMPVTVFGLQTHIDPPIVAALIHAGILIGLKLAENAEKKV